MKPYKLQIKLKTEVIKKSFLFFIFIKEFRIILLKKIKNYTKYLYKKVRKKKLFPYYLAGKTRLFIA